MKNFYYLCNLKQLIMNPILKIFKELSDEKLSTIINELLINDDISKATEFKKVANEVRCITNSTSISTDYLLVQTNIYKEGSIRFLQQNRK